MTWVYTNTLCSAHSMGTAAWMDGWIPEPAAERSRSHTLSSSPPQSVLSISSSCSLALFVAVVSRRRGLCGANVASRSKIFLLVGGESPANLNVGPFR